MEIVLDSEKIDSLSSNGVLAYVAVTMGVGSEVTTAALAMMVKARSTAMLDGLKELSTIIPELVSQSGRKWRCGIVKSGDGVLLQNLESERFRLFVDDLKKYWDFLNPNLPFQMGGRDGIQIRNFLINHPNWTQQNWRLALQNRKDSVVKHGVGTRTDPIWVWVSRLDSFASGMVDKFKNQVNGNGKAAEQEDRNRTGNESYLARRRAERSQRSGDTRIPA